MNAATSAPPAPSGVVPRRLLSDARLTRLAASGDSAAFATIFERFHQEIYRYCRAIVSDPDEAQDALQNTMTAALRALPGEQRTIALRPWLYRIAHNEAISIIRQRSHSAPDVAEGAERRSVPPPGTEGVATSAPSAQGGAEERERLRELVRDLSALPDRQRGALVMRELSGLGYAEIASALDCGEPAARQTVYEAREAMRDSKRGREMDCSAAREAISQRDGRILRGRALRAHLRTCEGCRDFRAAISTRSSDLQLLSPPLSAVVATSLLGAVLGHGAGGGSAATLGSAGAAGAGAGGAGAAATAAGAGGSAAMLAKGSAVIAALVVGAGAAGATGAIDLPFSGSSDEAVSTPTQDSGAAADAHSQGAGAATKGSVDSAGDGSGRDAGHKGEGKHSANAHSGAGRRGQAGEHGNGTPALGAGSDHALPPNSQGSSPPGNAVGNPHTSSSSPSSTTPRRSQSGAAHSNAGTTGPPKHSNAGGNGGNPRG